ncbi:lipase family protein [Alkalimonas amylolytica]|uniref:Lipase (Class 3) n=1 Tax=Alkalimonas amylolytica TaxID=152573 RepID=A0A1H3XK64_ALKAM|nr:lipase family protein [Alkalimonas amylolytica]SDZ99713.1 Lipase (class 3) [Alkalimonas amylolytica]
MSIPVLTPNIAAALAADVYDTIEMPAGAEFTPATGVLKTFFDFSRQGGAIHGRSGGLLFRRDSGFAVIGKGKSLTPYANSIAIAFRGTQTGYDWLSNTNTRTVTIENQTQAHKGFYELFKSMRPAMEQQLNPLLRNNAHAIVHCAGHSLGGALAQLAAIWIKKFYGNKVALYTFGAPRVGLKNFALQAPGSVDATYRCIHGDDPVPLAPVWPYYHAPYNGQVVRLTADTGIRVSSHKMRKVPHCYQNSARGDWANLISRERLQRQVFLKREDHHKVTFSEYWMNQIWDALTTLLRQSGGASAFVFGLQGLGAGVHSFYDNLAIELEKSGMNQQHSVHLEGLLACMLAFAGKRVIRAIELTARFIRWVFRQVLSVLDRAVRQAIQQVK